MKLIPEEISYLRKEARRLSERKESYYEYMKSREFKTSNGPELQVIGDVLTEESFQRDFSNYSSIIETLTNSEYVRIPQTTEIGIGTKFIVEYENYNDIDHIVLTESGFGSLDNEEIVSFDSPMGKEISGKKAGDTFEFTIKEEGRITVNKEPIVGIIKEIKTDPKCYLKFIRSRKKSHRISKEYQKENNVLLDYDDLINQEITESQRELLEIEIKKLSKKPRTLGESCRLSNAKKLLKQSKIAIPPTDNTIGIGSIFEIMITNGDETITNEYEMINIAVSDELEDEYVEKMSSLGTNVYGLQVNDTFKFRKGAKHYKGIVTNVNNRKQTTTNPIYQYKK